MEVSEVKPNLGKYVLHKPSWSEKEEAFILNAYIYKVDPRNPLRRISQVELLDNQCKHSLIITSLDSVRTAKIPENKPVTEIRSGMSEKTRLALEKFKGNLKNNFD